jgi:hypothetical protein
MPEFLARVDNWFLVLAGLAFLWMANRSFAKFDATQDRFQELIDRLFHKYEDLSGRVAKIEGRCDERDC